MLFFSLYFLTLLIFMAFDCLWLGLVAKKFYLAQVGILMRDKLIWPAGLIAYALFVAGLVFFAVLPALKRGVWFDAFLYGLFFGVVFYGAYDFTNLATLKGWNLKITCCDFLWGAFLSGLTTLLVFCVASPWKKFA